MREELEDFERDLASISCKKDTFYTYSPSHTYLRYDPLPEVEAYMKAKCSLPLVPLTPATPFLPRFCPRRAARAHYDRHRLLLVATTATHSVAFMSSVREQNGGK